MTPIRVLARTFGERLLQRIILPGRVFGGFVPPAPEPEE